MADINVRRGFSAVERASLPVNVSCEVHKGWGKTWLAKLSAPQTEQDRKFGVARTFLEVTERDLSRSGNGTLQFVIEAPGVYEASAVYRSYKTFRVVFRVGEDGVIQQLAMDTETNLCKVYLELFPELGVGI